MKPAIWQDQERALKAGRVIKRVFTHYALWEETKAEMWRKPTGEERRLWIRKCGRFMSDTAAFRAAMFRAIEEWPISCEVNLTANTTNRRAWIGHAACCVALGCPEEPTRAAWWLLTQEERDAADLAAVEAIAEWERRYLAKSKDWD